MVAAELFDGAGVADRRSDTVAALRRRLAEMPGSGVVAAAGSALPARVERSDAGPVGRARPEPGPPGARGAVPAGVALPEGLAGLLPGDVLPAGRITALGGGSGLRAGLLAAATAAGARCAVVGCPDLGLAAVAERGGRLDSLALVPDPGPEPAAVVSVLLDGLDLVLVDPRLPVPAPSRARVLAGRVRACGAVLLVGPGWPGADVSLEGRACGYSGLGEGSGRVRSVATVVRCSGRGVAPASLRWTVGTCRPQAPGAVPASAEAAGDVVRERGAAV